MISCICLLILTKQRRRSIASVSAFKYPVWVVEPAQWQLHRQFESCVPLCNHPFHTHQFSSVSTSHFTSILYKQTIFLLQKVFFFFVVLPLLSVFIVSKLKYFSVLPPGCLSSILCSVFQYKWQTYIHSIFFVCLFVCLFFKYWTECHINVADVTPCLILTFPFIQTTGKLWYFIVNGCRVVALI